jgi:hypothetical protein
MVTSWGHDASQHAALSRRAVPVGSPGNWLVSTDYPLAQAVRGLSSLVDFRLDVDEKGLVTGCHVQEKTLDSAAFGKVACQMISKRARFAPALDAQGKPARDYYMNSVNWVAP